MDRARLLARSWKVIDWASMTIPGHVMHSGEPAVSGFPVFIARSTTKVTKFHEGNPKSRSFVYLSVLRGLCF